jgi:hypothetical protein
MACCLPVVVFTQSPAGTVSARAKRVHDAAVVVDSHDDTTQRLVFDKTFDIAARNTTGNLDIEYFQSSTKYRMVSGRSSRERNGPLRPRSFTLVSGQK